MSLGNRYASTADGILRHPLADAIYVGVDKQDQLHVFLFPKALSNAYKKRVADRMTGDTRLMYRKLRTVAAAQNKRHISHDIHVEEADGALTGEDHGIDHFGCWYVQGRPNRSMYESADSWRRKGEGGVGTNYRRQCLFEYLHYTDGTMTKVLDFRFELFDPGLHKRHQALYRGYPKFARHPPTNDTLSFWCKFVNESH